MTMLDDRAADLAAENAELRRRLDETLAREQAAAEILQVINSSPGDLAPVFDAILAKAHALCGADHGALFAYDGDQFRPIATHDIPEPFAEVIRPGFRPHPENPLMALIGGEPLVHIADLVEVAARSSPDNVMPGLAAELGGMRTLLAVPLRKDGVVLGFIGSYRKDVRPFSDKQIALLQNFAAQAVIAMENARLLTETREALEYQTATAEVLGVINSSPGDLSPVFEAIVEKALWLCEAKFGGLQTYDGERFHSAAVRGFPAALAEFTRDHSVADTTLATAPGRIRAGEDVVLNLDLKNEEPYRAGVPYRRALVDLGGARSHLAVALRRDASLFGYLYVYRQEVRPFTERQIALLQNFAAQAVIAMENARLLTETREALEQQTATAEVLGVINSSPGDLAPVFDAILEKAHSLCGISVGTLQIYEGAKVRTVASRGVTGRFLELLQKPYKPLPEHPASRLLGGERIVHIIDLRESAKEQLDNPRQQASAQQGLRTALWVPLRKDTELLGYISAFRQEVQPFSDKQIALLENFAAQAVIAMENARLITETREALEQQTATAEVLGVINASPGNLGPVFDAVLEKAMRQCGASFGEMRVYEGDGRFRTVAIRGVPAAFAEHRRQNAPPSGPNSLGARVLAGERIIHIADLKDDAAYRQGDANRRSLVDLGGARSALAVALRQDEKVLGFITLYRQEMRAYAEKQIALLQSFAAQAVIAMENARLLTETREALEQQTATAEVLQVINSSPGDLSPVFDAMLEKAHSLGGIDGGTLQLYDGEKFQAVAVRGLPKPLEEFLRHGFRPGPNLPQSRLIAGEDVVHTEDVAEIDDVDARTAVELGSTRTNLLVALRKDKALLGLISASRREVRPFSDKQIALLQNFAAQAVIAMENARLLTETREALEQQTATAEVLQVINSSPGDLTPVFDAILEKAHHLCGVERGSLQLYEDGRFHAVAVHGLPTALAERLRQGHSPNPDLPTYELLKGAPYVHIADLAEIDEPMARAVVELGGTRTHLLVALRKDGVLLGQIVAARTEVRPFSDKQIALLENFAAQAVIAMENARLLGELRQRTDDLSQSLGYQTATSDVLKVISRTTFDLQPVLDTLTETAMRLCDADVGNLAIQEGDAFRLASTFSNSPEFGEMMRGRLLQPSRSTLAGRIALEARVIHINDLAADPEYTVSEAITIGKVRTALGVPMLREGIVVGTLTLGRQRTEPFTDRQIALVQTFADQAVIAMENARLLNELRDSTRDLQESLEYQTATSDVLKVISQSDADLTHVLQTALDTAARLCDAGWGHIFLRRGDRLRRMASSLTATVENREDMDANPVEVDAHSASGRAVLTGQVVQIADIAADPEYAHASTRAAGIRTMLGVPLLRDGVPIGSMSLARKVVEPFSDKQIELVRTFADQAVIAMENARLLGELRQRTDEVAELNRGLEARVAEQVDELGRVGRLKRFLAPQLAELIVSQGDEKILESHRREIVVVFCDLRGYTAFTETAEPEEVLDFLREYHGALGPLVSQFEGTLDQFSGDGIMVFFNDPVPIPDPAQRAVKMAIAMRDAAATLTAAWRRRGRVLGFGSGIAQGYATLGQIGFAERSGYTAIGTVCNLAARLCGEAKDEQILIAQRVAAAVEGTTQLEEIGELNLKGLTQPVAAFNVVAAAP